MAEIHEEMSELLDKLQNESLKKTSGVHSSSRKPMKKVCDENEERKKGRIKRLSRKNFCGERKDFIRLYQKNG